MTKQNIFEGIGSRSDFNRIIYSFIKRRCWFTLTDIMATHIGCETEELKMSVSKYKDYGELKKAVSDIRQAIHEIEGKNSIEEDGNNRNKRFRYVGKSDAPLDDMLNAKVIKDLRKYWQFCQDSAGLMPQSWLDYFFEGCQDLLDINKTRRSGRRVINSSIDRILTNINLLPELYTHIINKQVLRIIYKQFYEAEETLIFHPHYLKEFNGRWHLFGHAEGEEPEEGFNIAIDRIQHLSIENDHLFKEVPPSFCYDTFFDDIVGVTHLDYNIDDCVEGSKIYDIHIRTYSLYIHKLTETKPIHHKQETIIDYGSYADGEYGELRVQLRINNEFIGRILQMGEGLEVVSPVEVRNLIAKRAKSTINRYE